ncbi:hypothetical protein ACFQ60_15120 [Streptomyces zhihengii]
MTAVDNGRTPLMAGNWKMNLNHLEAIAHTQKLAFALSEKDFAAVEVAVLPLHRPALRPDPDRGRQARHQVRRPGHLRARLRRLHR